MPSITLKGELVINTCHGGFSLSDEAATEIARRKNITLERRESYLCVAGTYDTMNDLPRDDADLIAVVRELGEKANGDCARLKIVEVKVNVNVSSYDGRESMSFSSHV